MRNFLRTAFAYAADICWPRTCAVTGCGHAVDRPGRHICSRCHANLPWLEGGGSCKICGTYIPSEAPHDFICESCRKSRPSFEFARAALRYSSPATKLIKDFKFRKALWLREDFVDLLEAAVRAKLDASAVDVVVPVPLHLFRRIKRGYNQSSVLAEPLARRLNRKFDGSSLFRRWNTEHQTRLKDKKERAKNIKGAFEVKRPWNIRGRTVLVTDDVMTTGATLEACAKALITAGAARVWCVTIAKA